MSDDRIKNPDINIVNSEITTDQHNCSTTNITKSSKHQLALKDRCPSLVLDKASIKATQVKTCRAREARVRSSTITRQMTVYLAVDKTLKKPIASPVYGYVRARGSG